MNLKSNIDSVLSNGVHSGAVPGVIAAVANREGVIYEGAFGERSLGSGSSMTNDTVCWIASIAKKLVSNTLIYSYGDFVSSYRSGNCFNI